MGKEKKPVKKEAPKKPKKPSYYPKSLMLFGLLLIVVAVVDYFFYQLPREVLLALLVIAGLWILKIGWAKGLYVRRATIVKRYI